MDSVLEGLVTEAWRIFETAGSDRIVRPAIPILYFGDLDSYRKSDIKIITVGLNPSSAEFPTDDPLRRFPLARTLARKGCCGLDEADAYIGSLNGYFATNPYNKWFDGAFGGLLDGLSATYQSSRRSALHTDLCSPLATNPTWSGLSQLETEPLLREGLVLWHDLVRFLEPDLILISVAQAHLRKIQFQVAEDLGTIHRIERDNPYEVWAWRQRTTERKTSLLAYGKASQLPFGTVSRMDKWAIGKCLGGLVSG